MITPKNPFTLEEYIKSMEHIDPSLLYTIKTFKKSANKYIKTSVYKMPIDAPRLKSFIAHNGCTHKVVESDYIYNSLTIYIKVM